MDACQQTLNSWCSANCVHAAAHGPLIALFEGSEANNMRAWRCYSPSTLNAAQTQYASGSTYCTRDPQLRKLLSQCNREHVDPAQRQSVAVDAAGRSTQQQQPPTQQQQPRQQVPPQPAKRPVQQQPRPPPGIWGTSRVGRYAGSLRPESDRPTYEHKPEWLKLPTLLQVQLQPPCTCS